MAPPTTPWLNGVGQKLALAGVLQSKVSVVWNLVSGVTAAYNEATGYWDLTFSGGGGGLVVTGTPAAGYVPTWNGSAAVWAPVSPYDILTFTHAQSLYEVGTVLATPSFAATHSQTPDTLVLTNNQNGESKDVHATPTSFTSSQSYTFATPSYSVTWTLTGTKITSDVATRTASAAQRNFAGVATAAATLAAIVAAATYTTLDTNGTFSFSATSAGGSERVCIAFPTRYGTPTVTDADTNLGVGITLIGTSSYANASGYSENYDRYSFDSAFIGTKNFNVAN
jgi:hypothetical protein